MKRKIFEILTASILTVILIYYLNDRFSNIEHNIRNINDKITSQMNNLEKEITKIQDIATENKTAIRKFDDRIYNLNDRMSKIEGKLSQHDKQFARLNTKISTSESKQELLQYAFTALPIEDIVREAKMGRSPIYTAGFVEKVDIRTASLVVRDISDNRIEFDAKDAVVEITEPYGLIVQHASLQDISPRMSVGILYFVTANKRHANKILVIKKKP